MTSTRPAALGLRVAVPSPLSVRVARSVVPPPRVATRQVMDALRLSLTAVKVRVSLTGRLAGGVPVNLRLGANRLVMVISWVSLSAAWVAVSATAAVICKSPTATGLRVAVPSPLSVTVAAAALVPLQVMGALESLEAVRVMGSARLEMESLKALMVRLAARRVRVSVWLMVAAV